MDEVRNLKFVPTHVKTKPVCDLKDSTNSGKKELRKSFTGCMIDCFWSEYPGQCRCVCNVRESVLFLKTRRDRVCSIPDTTARQEAPQRSCGLDTTSRVPDGTSKGPSSMPSRFMSSTPLACSCSAFASSKHSSRARAAAQSPSTAWPLARSANGRMYLPT